jgi:hypothetical protein
MSNPYEPPLHFIDRIEILVYSPNTFLQRLFHAVYFSAESVLGLNAGVAVDEGISSTLVPPCLCVKKRANKRLQWSGGTGRVRMESQLPPPTEPCRYAQEIHYERVDATACR